MIAYETSSQQEKTAFKRVKIIGVGGAGNTVVDRLIIDGLQQIPLCAINTDLQHLSASLAPEKLQLGADITRGLGAGGDPEVGYNAAEAGESELVESLGDAEIVLLCAGLGGGTGSGVTPVLSRLARSKGAMVFALVTLPFEFEGRRRCQQAEQALKMIGSHCDGIIAFENERMGELILPKSGIAQAFAAADATMAQCLRAIIDLIIRPGLVRIGMDHLLAVLEGAGSRCVFGFGESDGENRSNDALSRALRNPLLDKGRLLSDARRVLVNISGGPSMSLVEVQTIMEELGRHTHDHTRIYFGMNVEQSMGRRLAVTILSAVGQPLEAMPEQHPMQNRVPQRQTLTPAVPTVDLFGKSEPQIEEETESLPVPEPVTRVQTPPVIAATTVKEHAENSLRQEVLQFEPVNRGRFEKSEPTIIDGEDLDVPTFLRKKQRL